MKSSHSRSWVQFSKSLAASLVACLVLASCASLIGPHQVDLPLTRLQQGLDRRFPIDHRILEIFDIQMRQPQLTILSEDERVSLTMEVTVVSPFMTQTRSGNLAFSGHLFIDTVRNAIFIRDARVDRFAIDGIDEERQRQLAMAASVLMDKIMKDVPIYSFRPDDLRYVGVQFVPTAITMTQNALAITLEPAQ